MMGVIERMMLIFFQSEQNTDIRSAACHQSRKMLWDRRQFLKVLLSPAQVQRGTTQKRRVHDLCGLSAAPDPRGKNSAGSIVGPAGVSQQARISFVHTLG